MTLSLGLTPEARADFVEARDWYETQRPGSGAVLQRSVEACFARFATVPTLFPLLQIGSTTSGPHFRAIWGIHELLLVFPARCPRSAGRKPRREFSAAGAATRARVARCPEAPIAAKGGSPRRRATLAGMDWRSRITIEPGKRGGKPCIRGLRMTVYDILEYLASGMSEDEILADFPKLEREDIRAALAFAAEREGKVSDTTAP